MQALELLRQQGWAEGHQGKGRYVLGRATMASRRSPEQAYALLNADKTAGVKIVKAGPVSAPARAASALWSCVQVTCGLVVAAGTGCRRCR